MDANGEGSRAPAPEKAVKQDESELPSNHEETKATYKSFKYVLFFWGLMR
jgi:hypothetical protein